MSYIDDIQNYFISRVQSVDADLEFFPDPFGEIDINNVIADRKFKCYWDDEEGDREGNINVENMPMIVEFYTKRTVDVNQAYNDLKLKAANIKNAIIDPFCVDSESSINDIDFIRKSINPLPTDDNTMQAVLEFNVRRDIMFT